MLLIAGVLLGGFVAYQLWGTGFFARHAQETLATFKTDVTIPIGHRCMGVLPRKAERVVDPLYAIGFVLLGPDQPIVVVCVDWCEIRNRSYDQWRDALAEAAGTVRQRVLLSSLHQHDAPVVDGEAEELLASVGLAGELFDALLGVEAAYAATQQAAGG